MPLFFAPSAREVGRAEVRAAGAEVRVAVQAAGLGEELRAGDRLRVVREALLLRPARDEASTSLASASFAVAPLYVSTPIERTMSAAATIATGRRSSRRSRAQVDERQREQQDEADRRDADRAEDHRLRPLEDPQQVEEEVEVPVGPRDEVDRPRVGLRRRPAGAEAVVVYFQTNASPMITHTTTRLITVSWNIAYG